jgi:hypothetical protein
MKGMNEMNEVNGVNGVNGTKWSEENANEYKADDCLVKTNGSDKNIRNMLFLQWIMFGLINLMSKVILAINMMVKM